MQPYSSSLPSFHIPCRTPTFHSPKMSADPPQTTPPPKSIYSLCMTPERVARLNQTFQPITRTTRKTKTPKTTTPPRYTSLQRTSHTDNSSSSSLVSPSAPRSTPIPHPPQPPTKETARLTRYRQPSCLSTSISAIPRLTSQFLSALAGPLITPRNLTTDILRTLLRDTSSSSSPPPSIYPSVPSTSLTQIPPSTLNILPVPLASSSRPNLHNLSTVVNSLFSYLIPILSTHPLLPFRSFSATTSESTQTDSYYLCPTCEWQPLPYPLSQTTVNLQGTLLTRIQTYLSNIPDIIRQYCGPCALHTTAHLLKILPTLVIYPLLPVLLACVDSPHRDTISQGYFPISLLHPLLLLQNTLVAIFHLYLTSPLFLPLSYCTPQRHFTHVLFLILGCLREATLHLFHEIPSIIRNHYPVPSLTLFCTIIQFGDLIVNHETHLLTTYLEQYYSIIYSSTIPSSPDTPPSSHTPSPPPSPTTLHHLYTPFALPHITDIPAEHLYRAYYDPTYTPSLMNLEQYPLFRSHRIYQFSPYPPLVYPLFLFLSVLTSSPPSVTS